MNISQTETEFVNAWTDSAASEVDSQALYSAYQHWVLPAFGHTDTDSPSFDVDAWLTGLLFANAGGEKTGSTSGKVGQHGLRHWIKRFIARCSFKNRSNFSKIGKAAGSKGKHEVSQNLLSDVENV